MERKLVGSTRKEFDNLSAVKSVSQDIEKTAVVVVFVRWHVVVKDAHLDIKNPKRLVNVLENLIEKEQTNEKVGNNRRPLQVFKYFANS
jgi:hypothetical protein